MNRREWNDAVERLQILMEPNYHSMGSVSKSNRDWGTYREYTLPEPHRSNVGWKELSPSSHHVYSKAPQMEDADGEPLPDSDEDEELARKKKQLREIEERILHKKASIAMKAVFVESSTLPSVSGNEQLAAREGETLRDRVTEILRQRQHRSYLSKVQSARERERSSSLSKDGVLREQHPLKLRVKALMKSSCSVLPSNSQQHPQVPDVPRSPPGRSVTSPAKRKDAINKGFDCFLSVLNRGVDISLLKPEDECGEPPDVSLPPPGRSISSPAKEENNINKGFERFLNILNKGVDIEMLSRVMNNDGDDLPLSEAPLSIRLPDMESRSDPSLRSERQRTSAEVSLPGLGQASLSQTSKGVHTNAEPDLSRTKESQRLTSGASQKGLSQPKETKDPPRTPHRDLKSGASLAGSSQTNITKIISASREQPCSLPAAEEKEKDSLGSSSRSPMEVEEEEEEREESPSVSEQHEQLQNVLKTLGWNLDVEEMSKLATRTHERLYGKKNDGADSREAQTSRPKRSLDRDRRKSSSSRSPLRSNKEYRSRERTCGRRRAESRGEDGAQQRRSLRDHRKSPSSSSSGSASSPSSSRQRRSRSRNLEQTRKVKRSRSGERSRERPKPRDRRGSGETERDQKDLRHFSPFPHPQNQTLPHPAASAFPDYVSSQFSQFGPGHSGDYNGATNPYWTYDECGRPYHSEPHLSSTSKEPQQIQRNQMSQNIKKKKKKKKKKTQEQYNIPTTVSASRHPYTHFPDTVVAPNRSYPDPGLLTGSASFPNPDLCVSEGQVRSSPAARCLTVINTKQTSSRGLTGGHKGLLGGFRNPENVNYAPKSPVAPQESKVRTETVDDANAEQEKSRPTEEEIKANLRRKLEAFNQKAKNTSRLPRSEVMQPANSLMSEME